MSAWVGSVVRHRGWSECEKHVLVSQTGHMWHVAKYGPKSDKSRQNVFPRCPFLLPPSPKGGQPASDRSLCLHLCLSLYDHQHIYPSDISGINNVIHAYWHRFQTCRLFDLVWTSRPQALRQQQEKSFSPSKKKCLIDDVAIYHIFSAGELQKWSVCLIRAQITLKIPHRTINKSALASSRATAADGYKVSMYPSNEASNQMWRN